MEYGISEKLKYDSQSGGIVLQMPQEQGEEPREKEQGEKKDYSAYDNYSKKRVTLIGYLLGVKLSALTSGMFDRDYLNTFRGKKEIEVIRAISLLRLNFLHSYDKIFKEKQEKGAFAPFEEMDRLIDVEALKYLRSQGIEPLEYGVSPADFTKHIANLNQLIEEHIEEIHSHIPEWIKWEYIKDLFIMPNCASGPHGSYYNSKTKAAQINRSIHEIRKTFYNNISFYPFQVYLNWNPKKRADDYGNILFNDCKFLKLVYSSHYDTFTGVRYVIDAKDEVKNNVYDFIGQAKNVSIFVDCENVDPYHFAATLKNLEQDKIQKIKQVVLYDDVNTTNAWDILKDVLHLKVVHEEVERVKGDKSLVDHALSIGVTKSYYEEQTESVIIASSDSDFWSLIRYLPQIRFFVMNERRCTSETIIQKLDDNKVPHCYMDEFAQDAIQPYKNIVLKRNLRQIIEEFNATGHLEYLSVDEMLEEVFHRSCITGHVKQIEKEKQDFYNKQLKKLRLVIEEREEGKFFKIELD